MNEIQITFDDRHYRVRGLDKNLSAARLHINLKADRLDAMHVDTLDLYNDRQRLNFVKRAAEELYVDDRILKKDVARILRQLEELQLAASKKTTEEPAAVEISTSDRRAAMKLLKNEHLLARIAEDFDACGLVGEETNRLIGYLACTSRHLPEPLALLVQSSSAAGKTTLARAVLAMMPPEETVSYSAMTGQSLYYMGAGQLKHKILAIAEEEGIAQASYALKLLQSEGELRLATTEKDPDTGRQQTQDYTVEGPVMMFLTTTAEHPDPELANRCLLLHVNETPEQTAAIHCRQRAAYAASGESNCEAIRQLHQNAQRLLEPLPVVIPWCEQLSFRADQTRMRREQPKYLQLIAALALLHQFQRERVTRQRDGRDESCIVASRDDVEVAGQLMSQVARSREQGLLPQTAQLLAMLGERVVEQAMNENIPPEAVRFTQRELRESFGWGDRQLRRHLHRLIELEYVATFRTGQGNGREYALMEGSAANPFSLGIVDATQLA